VLTKKQLLIFLNRERTDRKTVVCHHQSDCTGCLETESKQQINRHNHENFISTVVGSAENVMIKKNVLLYGLINKKKVIEIPLAQTCCYSIIHCETSSCPFCCIPGTTKFLGNVIYMNNRKCRVHAIEVWNTY